jgi:hypothetical protein
MAIKLAVPISAFGFQNFSFCLERPATSPANRTEMKNLIQQEQTCEDSEPLSVIRLQSSANAADWPLITDHCSLITRSLSPLNPEP